MMGTQTATPQANGKPMRRCAECRREFSSSSQYMGNNGGIICRNRKECLERSSQPRPRKAVAR